MSIWIQQLTVIQNNRLAARPGADGRPAGSLDKKLDAYDVNLAKQRYDSGRRRASSCWCITNYSLARSVVDAYPCRPLPPPIRAPRRLRRERHPNAQAQRRSVSTIAAAMAENQVIDQRQVVQRARRASFVVGLRRRGDDDHGLLRQASKAGLGISRELQVAQPHFPFIPM
jgi:hypothetical protein